MRQRVMIAIALSCNPKLIIADEPTTALDVTIQAQILKLMKDLSRDLGIALVLITHNLGIVARYADRVNVMYAARLAEQGTRGERVRETAAPLYRRAAALGAAPRPAARRASSRRSKACRPTCSSRRPAAASRRAARAPAPHASPRRRRSSRSSRTTIRRASARKRWRRSDPKDSGSRARRASRR